MSIEKIKVADALGKVPDPLSGQDIITSMRVEQINVDGNNANITVVLPAMNSDQKSQLNFAIMGAVQEIYPEAQVHVHLKGTNPMAPKPKPAMPRVKNIVAVASGKGGVGKSTISVNLALGLKKLGARVGLIDADLYGPSIPTMLGLVGQRPKVQDVNNKPMIVPLEAHGLHVISIGNIVEPEQAVVLRGPRLAGIIKQFFQDCLWPELDYLVVDLPPGTGDIQLTLVQTVPVTGSVLVTTPQQVAIADAIKAMNMFRLQNVDVPILGVVENMSWFTPAELPDNKYYLFGEGGGKQLAKESQSMLLGQVPLVQGIRESGDSGEPVMAKGEDHPAYPVFLKVAQNVVRQVAIRNETLDPTKIVRMNQ